METNEFLQFKELIYGIIELLEEDRQYVIRKLNSRKMKNSNGEAALEIAKQVISDFENLNKQDPADSSHEDSNQSTDEQQNADDYQTHYKTFQRAIEYQEERIEDLEEEMGLLRAFLLHPGTPAGHERQSTNCSQIKNTSDISFHLSSSSLYRVKR